MRCIVTAGPTYEPIDQVRRLTNHSTGSLGTGLAKRLASDGHEVILLRGIMATHTEAIESLDTRIFTTTDDLAEKLKKLAKEFPDTFAVFHAAAVSDFCARSVFQRKSDDKLIPLKNGKLSTRDGKLLLELCPTQKIILKIRLTMVLDHLSHSSTRLTNQNIQVEHPHRKKRKCTLVQQAVH